jgi:hypothetical protein
MWLPSLGEAKMELGWRAKLCLKRRSDCFMTTIYGIIARNSLNIKKEEISHAVNR